MKKYLHLMILMACVAWFSGSEAMAQVRGANDGDNTQQDTTSQLQKDATMEKGETSDQSKSGQDSGENATAIPRMETATLGAGCFWCVESVFLRLKGVESVKSGYMGGYIDNPTYQQVCTGQTGHAEVVQIVYDANQISFDELLEVFWQTHDPTTLNQQGPDFGTQYRSAVFYHNEQQRELAEHYKAKLIEAKAFRKPIVTEIVAAQKFYVAEDYHQDFFNQNPGNPYCRAQIPSKLRKLEKVFKDKLKDKKKK